MSGEVEVGSQYHFYMETHTCLARPMEEGQMDLVSSTQHMDGVHFTVAKALNVDHNKINISVRQT